MLIRCSGHMPFVFLANTKAASTSFHGCEQITRDCEIRIWNSKFGKHLNLEQIRRRYKFLFDVI